eukprot:7623775-Pyramimonas_sp.AAC.1
MSCAQHFRVHVLVPLFSCSTTSLSFAAWPGSVRRGQRHGQFHGRPCTQLRLRSVRRGPIVDIGPLIH